MPKLHVRVQRQRPDTAARYDHFDVEVPDDANVIDVIEACWRQDQNLMYRHACHHASCGTCAVRVDGKEVLPCIVPLAACRGGEMTIEPLRNFPVVGDLVVDVSAFFQRQAAAGMVITRDAEETIDGHTFEPSELLQPDGKLEHRHYNRFENCVECGICLSACPTLSASDGFFGPAGLAAVHRAWEKSANEPERAALLELADREGGVWQCHGAFECSEACPQDFDPAGAIMDLRRALIRHKLAALFGSRRTR